jgi:hypothetical protein
MALEFRTEAPERFQSGKVRASDDYAAASVVRAAAEVLM